MPAASPTHSEYFLSHSETGTNVPFMICTMFTKTYTQKATRLASSLQKLRLPFSLYEVPSAHRSISQYGNDDLTYCKPSFIEWSLNRFQQPVLYVDADCVFCEKPELIWVLAGEYVDFAIYNWFSDLRTTPGYRTWRCRIRP